MKRIDWIIFFIITAISVFILKDLFKPGFYTSHDGIHQVVRLYYFDQAVMDGQIPPRWVGGLLNGFGYPLFNFSYQMPWIIAEPLHLFGLPIIDSVKMTFLLGFMFSGWAMYCFQKELFGRVASFGGTMIYLLAPYRFSNIFVRGAIGDATVFIFLPILFLSFFKLKNSKILNWKWVAIGALSLSSIFLSHAMVSFFVVLALGFYIVYSFFINKNKVLFLKLSVAAIFLSLCLSAYYLIPSMTEKNITVFDNIMRVTNVGNTYVPFKDLLYMPWGYGTLKSAEGRMSLQLGIAQWLVFAFALIMIFKSRFSTQNKKSAEINTEGIYYLLLFLISVFLIVPQSAFIWKTISNYIIIDYTFRALVITVFASSFLAGYFFTNVRFKNAAVIFFILLAFYANRNHMKINQVLDWDMDFMLKLEKTTNSYDEYIPRWVETAKVEKPREKIEIDNGYASFLIEKNTSNRLNFLIDATSSGNIKINTVYYPGWNIYRDGINVKPEIQGGLMQIPFEKGIHNYSVKFEETPLRKVSNLITILAVLFTISLFLKYRKYV